MSPARRQYTVGWDDAGPISQDDHDAHLAGSDIVQPAASDLGPVTGQTSPGAAGNADVPDAPAGEPAPVDPDGEVPEHAADVAAWIDAADDRDEAARRAELAWSVEVARSGDPRKTVVDAVDPYLEDADTGT